jgi:hypothetical protein
MKIYKQLLLAQAEMPTFKKDGVNPHFKKSYLTLPTLLSEALPILRKHGLLFTCQSDILNDKHIFKVEIICVEDNSKVVSNVPMINISDMQKVGQAFTYGERYGLLGLLGLAPDVDNDGEDLVKPVDVKTQNVANKTKITDEIRALFPSVKDVLYFDNKDYAAKLEALINNNFEGIDDLGLMRALKWIKDNLK